MKNKRGIAKNNFRADGGKAWNPGKVEFIGKRGSREAAPKAAEARRRMIEEQAEDMKKKDTAPVHFAEAVADQQAGSNTPGHLTDTVVNDYMGGSNAAAKQADAYKGVFDSIKAGRTADKKGSVAAEARRRMIEREEGGHPDSGRDKADRRAYPRHE